MPQLDQERRQRACGAGRRREPPLERPEPGAAVPLDEHGRALERHHAVRRAEDEDARRRHRAGGDDDAGERDGLHDEEPGQERARADPPAQRPGDQPAGHLGGPGEPRRRGGAGERMAALDEVPEEVEEDARRGERVQREPEGEPIGRPRHGERRRRGRRPPAVGERQEEPARDRDQREERREHQHRGAPAEPVDEEAGEREEHGAREAADAGHQQQRAPAGPLLRVPVDDGAERRLVEGQRLGDAEDREDAEQGRGPADQRDRGEPDRPDDGAEAHRAAGPAGIEHRPEPAAGPARREEAGRERGGDDERRDPEVARDRPRQHRVRVVEDTPRDQLIDGQAEDGAPEARRPQQHAL